MIIKKICILLIYISIYSFDVNAQEFQVFFQIKSWLPVSSTPDPVDFRVRLSFDKNPGNALTEASTGYVEFVKDDYGDGTFFVQMLLSGLGAIGNAWEIGWPFTIKVEQVAHGTNTVIAQTTYNDVLPFQDEAWWSDLDPIFTRPPLDLGAAPSISIDVEDVALCTGVAGTATATVTGAEGAYTVTWSGGIMTSGDGTTGNISASLPAGVYTATAMVDGTPVSKEFQLTRKTTPDKPQITMEKEQAPDGGLLNFKVKNVVDGDDYLWFVNNRLLQTGGERFEAENLRNGDVVVCKNLDSRECASEVESDRLVVDHRLLSQQAGEKYFVPNLVTPNGDGLNDTWRLDWLQSFSKYRVAIYNGQGKIVYQTDSYQNDWNGRVDGKIRYGVYTYKIELPEDVVLQSWLEVKPTNY